MRAIVAALILLYALAACTSESQEAVQVPTLAVLPSETPTFTPTATNTATLTSTPTATFTPSNTPTLTPSVTPTATLVCFKDTWWQEVDPVLVQFFDEAQRIGQLPRLELSGAIVELYRLQNVYEAIKSPPCMSGIKFDLDMGIHDAIEAFTRASIETGNDRFSAADFYFSYATQYFFQASGNLLNEGFSADSRMANTASSIWGGDPPDRAAATQRAQVVQTREAELDAPLFQPTPTPTACDPRGRVQANTWVNQMTPIFNTIADAQNSATIRGAHDALEALPYPDCIAQLRGHLLNNVYEAYLASISSTPTTAREHSNSSDAALQRFFAEAERLRIGVWLNN